MLTAELIQQTESRFSQRQPIRHEREAKIKSGAILQADTSERVRARIQHLARAVIETEGVSLGAPGQPTAASAAVVIERILGKSDLMSINYLDVGARVARTIGRIHVRTASGAAAGFGTGFLVSPRLLLTNNHVLEDAASAGASRVEFNFQEGADGKLLPSIFVDLDPATFFVTHEALDFSLVALKGDLRNVTKFGWNGLSAAEGKLIVGEYVTIIQHPSGERKQIALRENQTIDVLEDFVHYRTDTSPGSSGSPVFNDQWEIVALHHSGVPRKDAQGRILTKDGAVWNKSMGEHRIHWIANEGVRISRILKHIQGLTLAGAQANLRKQIIDSGTGWRSGSSTAELVSMDGLESASAPGAWTLPLQLTIAVGSGGSGGLTVSAAPRLETSDALQLPREGSEETAAQLTNVAATESFEHAAPARVESALEWLAGESSGASSAQEQLSNENDGALW